MMHDRVPGLIVERSIFEIRALNGCIDESGRQLKTPNHNASRRGCWGFCINIHVLSHNSPKMRKGGC